MQDLIRQHGLFEGIAPELISPLLERSTSMRLEPDDILLRPGQKNRRLFLLLSGRLEIRFSENPDGLGLVLSPGECVGDMSLIERRAVSAWVVALGHCELIAFEEDAVWSLLATIPGVARNLLRMLSRRMRRQNEHTRDAMAQELRLQHLHEELANAQKIQLSMLPSRAPLLPPETGIEVAAMMQAATEVGGDFYDVIALGDQRFALLVGDVSGKGMPAALFMVKTLTLFRSECQRDGALDSIVTQVNRRLCEDNSAYLFVTLFAAVLDAATGQLTYVNAGHNVPLLMDGAGRAQRLPQPRGGMLLGVDPQAEFEPARVTLRREDTLLLFTDGANEARNGARAFYGEQRLMQAFSSADGAAAGTVLARVLRDIAEFVDDHAQSDDLTLMVVRYTGSPNAESHAD